MLFYVLFLVAAVMAFTRHHPAGPAAYVLAVLPALPIIGVTVSLGLYLSEEKDELYRTITVQSLLWSTGATLTVTSVWGFLENFVNVPHLQAMWVYPLFCVFVVVTGPLVGARYK
jgi:hypothetical protein